MAEIQSEYDQVRIRTANRKPKGKTLPYDKAMSAGLKLDWDNYLPPIPTSLGVTGAGGLSHLKP